MIDTMCTLSIQLADINTTTVLDYQKRSDWGCLSVTFKVVLSIYTSYFYRQHILLGGILLLVQILSQTTPFKKNFWRQISASFWWSLKLQVDSILKRQIREVSILLWEIGILMAAVIAKDSLMNATKRLVT